jgi:oxygen-independent coproporphyrinogen-3 oxidase
MTTISLPIADSPTTAPASGCSAAPATPPAPASPVPEAKQTTVGNYFVANYPPFGFWTQGHVADFNAALDSPPRPGTDLGLYVHIPFCRKRCHFCYFRVYTDKNAADIRSYIDSVLLELAEYASRPAIKGRQPTFIYFGGGTPSYLSPDQLRTLTTGMKRLLPWTSAREVAFEAEPGTINELKLAALKEIGVTRLSLGIEHFDDHVLETNGRAHRSKEITRAFNWARAAGFNQINVDLIAGMLEETDERWADTIAKTIALGPESVTIYQMEIPYNTTIYQRMKAQGDLHAPVADWETKRRWVDWAFEQFKKAGYSVVAATTVVKNPGEAFLYRKGLFDGSDLLSAGVSAFGHLSGVNYQNQHDFQPYLDAIASGRLPTYRAYPLTEDENYIRELALQLKNGRISIPAFTRKFGVDPRLRFATQFAELDSRGLLTTDDQHVTLTRAGLLQVDRLLYSLFLPKHQTGRYA